MSEEFCVSSKLLPENSFPFENSQPLLHVHIKTLCIIYNTMQWHVCMGTVIRLCVMSELHCESSEWQLCTYKTLTSWHLKLFIEGLSTFQLQTYDLAPPPGKDITIIYPVTLATLLLKRNMSDILRCSLGNRLHYISICIVLHLLLPSQVGGWSETIIMGPLSSDFVVCKSQWTRGASTEHLGHDLECTNNKCHSFSGSCACWFPLTCQFFNDGHMTAFPSRMFIYLSPI